MEYVDSYTPRPRPRPSPLPAFSVRAFTVAVGLLIFALAYITIGLRWHINRARAAPHAQREMQSTFLAADYERAARNAGRGEDAPHRAAEFARMARMHARAAEEAGRLRRLYEEAW